MARILVQSRRCGAGPDAELDAAARREVEALASVARQSLADVRATAAGMREVRLAAEIAAARSVLDAAGIESVTPSALPCWPGRRGRRSSS